MTYKYLVLDLDNTLYPAKSGLLRAIDAKIDDYLRMKLDLNPHELTSLRHNYWKKYGTTLGGMIAHHGTDPEDYIQLTYNVDITQFISEDQLLEQTLRRIHLPKVVFSNSPLEYVQKVLGVLGISKLIDRIYDIRFCHYLGKPNPTSYQEVIADLGVLGEECIFVDDVRVNVLGAEQAGMTSIWLTETRNESQWVIEKIHDLPNCLEQIYQAQLTA